MERTARAIWRGNLKGGDGRFSVGSGVFSEQKYDFRTRFENEPGTNPEELIAAAHASCFSMALSGQLEERGIIPEAIETTCAITLQAGAITRSALQTTVHAPGADRMKVEEAGAVAKAGCPVSKALNMEITLDLTADV